MKRHILIFFVILLPSSLLAQGVDVWPRHVIDKPTAGVLPRGAFDLGLRFIGGGGVLMDLNVGLSDRISFGASYGGFNVLGADSVNWNPAPGVHVRYQLVSETIGLPGITIGFESQGFGAYIDSTSRYFYKSPGFFVVGSKSYSLFERLDFHGGINYSLEDGDGDNDINLFLGTVLAFDPHFEIMAEYDLAFNDSPESDRTVGDGKGYLNAGVRLNVQNVLYLEFFLKNLLDNQRNIDEFTREFKITYFQFINLL